MLKGKLTGVVEAGEKVLRVHYVDVNNEKLSLLRSWPHLAEIEFYIIASTQL